MSLKDKKVSELKGIATKLGVKSISNIRKQDLINRIKLAKRNKAIVKKNLSISQKRGVKIALNLLKKDLSQIKSIKMLKSGKLSLTTDKNKTISF